MSRNNLYNEKELLLRIEQGDGRAFSELYSYYQPIIYKVAFRLTGEQEIAKDILQDTFASVWLNRATLSELDNFSGWLFTIARNLTMNALSGMARRDQHISNYIRTSSHHTFERQRYKVEEKDLEQIIRKAIAELPDQQLKVYRLIKEQGLSRGEAAEELGIAPETVKTHLERAMRYIRARLIKYLEMSHLTNFLIYSPFFFSFLSPNGFSHLS